MSDSDLTDATAELRVELESSEQANLLLNALRPETDGAPSERATVRLSVQNSTLIIKVSAGDITALRASMNSYLSWISGCLRAIDSVTSQKS